MIDPIVRSATASDAPALDALEAEARATVLTQRGGTRWLEEHDRLGADWAQRVRDGGVLVGVLDDVVVGYLVCDVFGAVATVSQVWVTPDAREVGLGDALLAGAASHARTAGCDVIEGTALPGDRATKNLYERAGITARLIVVSRRLDQLSVDDD